MKCDEQERSREGDAKVTRRRDPTNHPAHTQQTIPARALLASSKRAAQHSSRVMAMDGAASKAFVDALYRKVLLSVKASNAIPSEDDDFHYHSKFSKAFAAHVSTSGAKLEELVWQLTRVDKAKKKSGSNNNDDDNDDDDEEDDAKKRELFDGPEPKSSITDFVDALLDEATKQLELFQRGPAAAASGLRPLENKPLSFDKKVAKAKDEKDKTGVANMSTSNNNNSVRHSRGMAKPQNQFNEQIDNSEAPFVSKLREKAHALHNAPVIADDEDSLQLQHPYYPEIKALKYAEWQLEASQDAFKKIPLEDASFLWVNSDETLAEMMKSLSKPENRVIAVDLEHHSYRSYLGLVCLMQISTANEDFLVDTLALRSKLQILNTVFCDPQKVKVLHGSDMDILWLQRDLGLYIVNMFDTGQAARLLQYPRFSLAYLLKRHCAIDADKQYQLADWRIRPLEKNMIKYAREDTRYLLYIYDQMKHELLASSDKTRSSLLFEALQNSSKICLQVYVKPEVNDDDCVALSDKLKGTVGIPALSELQRRVFAMLYFWRDRVARLEDESTAYVLPNHALMKITKQLPTKSDQLFRTCNPVPPLVRKYAHELTSQISAEKTKLAAEEAKAVASDEKQAGEGGAAAAAKKSTHWRAEQDEDVVMESSTFTSSVSHMSEYAGWESGKRKAKCMEVDAEAAAGVSSGLRASFAGLSTTAGEDNSDESAIAKLEKVNQLVVRTAFTVSENDRVETHMVFATPVTSAASTAQTSASEAIPQSISETYHMTNRAKRRKTQQVGDGDNDDEGENNEGAEIALPPASSDASSSARGKKSAAPFKAFDYSAASEQIAGAKFDMADATKANDRPNGKKKRGVKQQGSGYNPFVAIRGAAGDATPDELQGAKKAVKKMHHMPRSATFR